MSRDTAIRLLNKYELAVISGSSFSVAKYNQSKKMYDILGWIDFDKDQLLEIGRYIDTEGWSADEGFSVARALYETLNVSILRTDSDGAKRANATIVIRNLDVGTPSRNVRSIDI